MVASHKVCGHIHDHAHLALNHDRKHNHGLERSHTRSHDHSHKHSHKHNHDHSHDYSHDHADIDGHAHKCGHDHDLEKGLESNHEGCSHGCGIWAYLPHGHGLQSRINADRKSLLCASAILCISLSAQLLGGFLVDSSVLEAEAVHTALDGLVIVLSLLSIALAGRRSSKRYSYGYARAEILSALVSVLALALMCINLLVGAVRRIPAAIEATNGGMGVAKGKAVMIAEGITLVNNVLVSFVLSSGSSSLNIRALRAHVVGDSIGNIVVLTAGAIMWTYPRMAMLDPVMTIVVVIGIVALNVGLAKDTLEVLMQAAPGGFDVRVMEKTLRNLHGVAETRDCHVWTLTTGVVVASVKIFMDENIRHRDQFQELQDEAEVVLRDAGVDQVTIQVRYSPCISDNVACEVIHDTGDLLTSTTRETSMGPYVLVGTEEV